MPLAETENARRFGTIVPCCLQRGPEQLCFVGFHERLEPDDPALISFAAITSGCRCLSSMSSESQKMCSPESRII